MWIVATLCIIQYGKYRLSAMKDSEEPIKIVNIFLNSKLNSNGLQKPSKVGKNLFPEKKSEGKNHVGMSLKMKTSVKNMVYKKIVPINKFCRMGGIQTCKVRIHK
jgi:hypothetical protein